MRSHSTTQIPSPSNQGLDTSVVERPRVVCEICHKSFFFDSQLHIVTGHQNAKRTCGLIGCKSSFDSCTGLRKHRKLPHSPSHHPSWDDSAIACAECNETFKYETGLIKHGKDQKHSPYACSCGAKFARIDALGRHIKSFLKESAQYHCPFCKRYRGKQAFRRKDHLVQHLKGYHKTDSEEIDNIAPLERRSESRQLLSCPYNDCAAYRDDSFRALPWKEQFEGRPFQKQSEYNEHMRKVHGDSAFPCPVDGCDRVGTKGYMREKDLIKHLAKMHPGAPSYVYVAPEPSEYDCVGCGKKLSSLDILEWHEAHVCKVLRDQ
ncbi:hypothetical protein F5B22DRAFT_599595 [Xylaria bambusicola]|uniref:uncharacterized protein n=1 Tax=Xylaria bambusicola TaxID=326684 RepID=UPI0020077849|nr:uncharacterized protein F5B22DRAFT_599595 [Xylaria bambusicola]KAI0518534.1 hypothetical protein F5B22DRAFT_599595 [Xylaria bambusicola]